MAPPSRLWKPTNTGGLLGSAFTGAAVGTDPPLPAAVVAAPEAVVLPELAVVAAPVSDAAAVVDELLSSLPQAAASNIAAAHIAADSLRAFMFLPLTSRPVRR